MAASWLDKCLIDGGAREEYAFPNGVLTKHQREEINEYCCLTNASTLSVKGTHSYKRMLIWEVK